MQRVNPLINYAFLKALSPIISFRSNPILCGSKSFLYYTILCCICVVYKYVNYTQLIFIRVNSFVSRCTSIYLNIYI